MSRSSIVDRRRLDLISTLVLICLVLTVGISFFVDVYGQEYTEVSEYMRRFYIVLSFAAVLLYLYFLFTLIGMKPLRGKGNNWENLNILISVFLGNIVVFSMIYFSLELFDQTSFTGGSKYIGNVHTSLVNSYLDMLYFSFVTFFTVGYGDIIPRNYISKIFTMLQISSSFIVTVYVYAKVFAS